MANLRSKEADKQYRALLAAREPSSACPLCEAISLQEFEHWRLIPNAFPYDRIASVHHMLLPKRHVVESELNEAEKAELYAIKRGYIDIHYEFLLESTERTKSIPEHFHLHVIVVNEE